MLIVENIYDLTEDSHPFFSLMRKIRHRYNLVVSDLFKKYAAPNIVLRYPTIRRHNQETAISVLAIFALVLPIMTSAASMEGDAVVNCRFYEKFRASWECSCTNEKIPSIDFLYDCLEKTGLSELLDLPKEASCKASIDIKVACKNDKSLECKADNSRRAKETANCLSQEGIRFARRPRSLEHIADMFSCMDPDMDADTAKQEALRIVDMGAFFGKRIVLDDAPDHETFVKCQAKHIMPVFRDFLTELKSAERGTWHKKMLDHLMAKGLMNGQARFEHEWLFLLRSEFNYHDTQLLSEGTFSKEDLDAIKDYMNRIQMDIDRRTAFSDQPSIGEDQGRSIPDSTVKRIRDEQKADLEKILHMWDAIAAIGGMVKGAAGGSHPILEQGTQGRRGGAIDTKIYAPESGPWR